MQIEFPDGLVLLVCEWIPQKVGINVIRRLYYAVDADEWFESITTPAFESITTPALRYGEEVFYALDESTPFGLCKLAERLGWGLA